MSLRFRGSPKPTIGVEVEFQLIDRRSRDLVPAAPRILEALPSLRWLKPELMQSTIEINTRVCRDIAEVRRDLTEKTERVHEVAARRGVALAAAGTHPFARWEEQKITENERYHRLLDMVQWPARRLLTFGLHVHIGVRDGETAIQVINHLEPWLPHLLAVTASSPFWRGHDTGLASSRSKIFEGLPTAGLPHRHKNWQEFARLMDALVRARAVESIREIWWDLRPHPDFGTVEVRVCDAAPTLDETVAVTALVQALVVHLARQVAQGVEQPILHRRIVKENKWRAARWSTNGATLVDEEGTVEPIPESLAKLIRELEPIFDELGSAEEVPRILAMLEDARSHERQRRVFRERGSLEAVVDSLIAELETNQPACAGSATPETK